MRHFETHEPAGNHRQSLPTRSGAPGSDITAIREKAHALMAGQASLLSAPVFELRAADARAYRLQLNGSGRSVEIARHGSQALTALREITLPLNRPIVLLIEDGGDFTPEDVSRVATMAGIGHDGQTLCPGSLILCGADRVFWV